VPVEDQVVTFEAARSAGPFELARQWADTGSGRSALAELATMAALRSWLAGWLPLQIHRAVLDGASLEDVSAATGLGAAELVELWESWARAQRTLWDTAPGGGRPIGVSADEYAGVAALLGAEPAL
jgi:hypothetical protein